MRFDHIAVRVRNFVLQSLDIIADEFDDLATIQVDHMVVMLPTIQFIDRLATFKIVLDDDPRCLELGQHAIHRRQTDVFLVRKQLLVDILGSDMLHAGLIKYLQDPHARMRHLQTGFAQFFGFLFHEYSPKQRQQARSVSSATLPIREVTRMQKLIALLAFALLAISVGGCHLVYTPDVQQGNLLDKAMVDQLKPGMTKRQTLLLMGTPSVSTPFEKNRWDYVSTMSRRGGPLKVRTFTLTFNNDILVRTEGDFFAEDAEALVRDSKKYHSSYPVDGAKGDKGEGAPVKKGSDPDDTTTNPEH